EGDDAYQAALAAAGLSADPELRQAFRNWVDDAYDDEFYADDDGGHAKSVRLIGWLVFQRAGGAPGEKGGQALQQAFSDAGVRDVYGLSRLLAAARASVDERDRIVVEAFKPRRGAFDSRFLVQKGLNADVGSAWLGRDGRP